MTTTSYSKFIVSIQKQEIGYFWSGTASSHKKKIFCSPLKIMRDLRQDRGGDKILTGGILKYSEDINFDFNKDIGSKGFFETACQSFSKRYLLYRQYLISFQHIQPKFNIMTKCMLEPAKASMNVKIVDTYHILGRSSILQIKGPVSDK